MRRDQLEHILRAAGAISTSDNILVIGSQSILGQFPDTSPSLALRSMEADVVPLDHPENAILISGSMGEDSPFHETFGYYAEGVGLDTAIVPRGWRDRLFRIDNENTRGVIGYCLEIHDLLISKYIAGRDKDREYCRAVVFAGLADEATLRQRLADTDVDDARRQQAARAIETDHRTRGQA